MARILLLLALFFSVLPSKAQIFSQYFDGADTNAYNSLFVQLSTDSSNVWQIGKPQKILFDSANTTPNTIITDTINYYPVNANSSFTFSNNNFWWNWGIMAVRWTQKLDLDSACDGGIVEFSIDSGNTWQNVFNNPYVYNFYGFDTANVDSLITGEYAFTGTDTAWKDVWLCFDYSFVGQYDSIIFRFTLKSDSVDNQKEGWMIDNLKVHITSIHTVAKGPEQLTIMKVYPTNTTGIINIEGEKLQEQYYIKNMHLVSVDGKVVKEYGLSPVKFYIDISDQPDGLYYLNINTNKSSKTFPVLLKR